MSERSIEFNNAGVECVEVGNHRMAWDLFKGALEVKLSLERYPISRNQVWSQDIAETNTYIKQAEHHLSNLVSLRRHHPDSGLPSAIAPSAQSRQAWENFSVDASLYPPFLFTDPIRLDSGSVLSTRRESASIIFNLALVDHLKNRCSEQAVALYELAMSLLTGDVVDLLGIALMNNIGVWCYENGDHDGSLKCTKHLATFIGACGCLLTEKQRCGIQSNVLWLANPPFAASPAA